MQREATTPRRIRHGQQSSLRCGDSSTFMDKYDVTGRPVSGYTSIQIKEEEFRHSWDPRNRVISKGRIIFMSMLIDIEYMIKNNQQPCLAHATEVTEYLNQFKLGHWVFLWTWTRTRLVSHVLEQTKRIMGSHCRGQ